MLKFKNVHIKTDGGPLFQIQDLELKDGLVALMGRNGAGKSTLIKSILGNKSLFEGTITLDNKNIGDFAAKDLAKLISVVATKPTLFGNHSGREVLNLGRLPYQNLMAKLTAEDKVKVDEIIALLNLGKFSDRRFTDLSDGEKQMIMIGRAMVQDTQLILLDEPSAFLDLVNRHQLMKLMREIVDKTGKLILFSTHQTDDLEKYCDTVLLIEKGQLLNLKNPATFKADIYKSFGLDEV
ncbi:ABC transporter ATP-binding protein [Crocinitomix catalasitica]|uniref:ABC transporter ATP-binding protein n=1 Tax=Crocinitomix catalasitica TaxID=184607 RepID=UPI000686EBF6|nr:ABC transporter ATP-binding protein [Crocinitomix catalasitica]